MHELVHYYVYATTHRNMDVYGINQCTELLGRDAILNPNSYTYYAASEYFTFLRHPILCFYLFGRVLIPEDRYTTGLHQISNSENSARWSRWWWW